MITKKILQKENSLGYKLINKIGAWGASCFSVIFALSIVREYLQQETSLLLKATLIVFTFLFLIFNEYIKVRELRKLFVSKMGNIYIISLTFLISVVLSSAGIYFWVDKGSEITEENINYASHEEINILNKYNYTIDSLYSLEYSDTKEYQYLNTQLSWWKKRSPANIQERQQIRDKISEIASSINTSTQKYNNIRESRIKLLEGRKNAEINRLKGNVTINDNKAERNHFITVIFMCMVIMTEILIVFLNKEHGYIVGRENKVRKSRFGKEFIRRYNILTEILMRKRSIELSDIKYSPFNRKRDVNLTRDVYHLFKQLGIKNDTGLKVAQDKLIQYYEELLNI